MFLTDNLSIGSPKGRKVSASLFKPRLTTGRLMLPLLLLLLFTLQRDYVGLNGIFARALIFKNVERLD
jgi:hypothetical protein